MALFNRKDLASDALEKLAGHLNAELEASRVRLESHQLTPEQTAALRGGIAAYRSLLALVHPDPASAPGSRSSGNRADDEGN